MSDEPIKPGHKYSYSEPFLSQFLRSLNGYAPPNTFIPQKTVKARSGAQEYRLKKLGVPLKGMPATMWECSKLIDKLMNP